MLLNKSLFTRNTVILVIKIVLAIIVITFLLKNGSLDFDLIMNAFSRPGIFSLALLCLFSGIVLSGVRWWILLSLTGNNFSLRTIMSLQLMGSFFSSWLPGAVGGDAVRGVLLFRLMENGRSTALFSIVMDRVFATFGLISIAVFASFSLSTSFTDNAMMLSYLSILKMTLFGLFISILFIIIVIWISIRFSLFRYLPNKIKKYVSPIAVAIIKYRDSWPTLIFCSAISTLASGVVVIGIVFIADIFYFAPDPSVTAIAGVMGNVSSVIPLTPGGLGVGEAVFAKICTDLSGTTAPFATIYFTFRVAMLISNIPGLIITLIYNHTKHLGLTKKRHYIQ